MRTFTDVVIVGAGPIGLEVAHALKIEGVEYQHLDAGPIGATMGWWAPGTKFFSSPERIGICGVPIPSSLQEKTTREEYIAYLRAVAQQLDLPVRTHERVARAERMGDGRFLLHTESAIGGAPGEIVALRVVLSIGNMHRPRRLGVPGEDRPGVSHYLRDPHEYYGKRVLIVGGKNSAVEAAIRLYRAGAQVAMSYRQRDFDPERVKYWLLPELKWLIEKARIGFWPCTAVRRIGPGGAELEGLEPLERRGPCPLAERHDVQQERGDAGPDWPAASGITLLPPGERATLAADMTLLLTGYEQDTTLFEQLGVELMGEERRPRFDHETMQTSAPGVFVAGTATAGSERRTRVFIENSHVHAERIAAAIAGRTLDPAFEATPSFGRQEES